MAKDKPGREEFLETLKEIVRNYDSFSDRHAIFGDDGKLFYISNEVSEKIFSADPEDLVGKSLSELTREFSDDTKKDLRKIVRRTTSDFEEVGNAKFYKKGKKSKLVKSYIATKEFKTEDYEGKALILDFEEIEKPELLEKIIYTAEDAGFTKEYLMKDAPKDAGKLAAIVAIGAVADGTVEKVTSFIPAVGDYVGAVTSDITRALIGWQLTKKWFTGENKKLPTKIFEVLGKTYAIGSGLSGIKQGISIAGTKLGLWASGFDGVGTAYSKITDISKIGDIIPTFKQTATGLVKSVPALGIAILDTAGVKFGEYKSKIAKIAKDYKFGDIAKPIGVGTLGFIATKIGLGYLGVGSETSTHLAGSVAGGTAFLSADSDKKGLKATLKTGAFLFTGYSLSQVPFMSGSEGLITKVSDYVTKITESTKFTELSKPLTLAATSALGIGAIKYLKDRSKDLPKKAWSGAKYVAGTAWKLKAPIAIGAGTGLVSYLALKEGLPAAGIEPSKEVTTLAPQYMGTMASYLSCSKKLVKDKVARTIGKVGSLIYGAGLLGRTPFVQDGMKTIKTSAEKLIPSYEETTEKLSGLKGAFEGAKSLAYKGAKTITGKVASLAPAALILGGLGETVKAAYKKVVPSRS